MFSTKPLLGASPRATGLEQTQTASSSSSAAPQFGSLPSISLPKGGGSITGSGEKFKVNAASGSGSLSVPLATTAGRDGFGPGLSLSYNTGTGNGPFGLGWELSAPCIVRKTSMGLPQYLDAEESDVFLLAGVEDLVPVFQRTDDGKVVYDPETGDPVIHTESRDGFLIRRYAPRIEGSFMRIERWTKMKAPGKGQIHWRVLSPDNLTAIYGRDDNSRIFNPGSGSEDGEQCTFSWLLSEQYDCKGNAMIFKYKAEDSAGVATNEPHERHRMEQSRSANRYLKLVQYGNRTPNRDMDWKAFSAFELDDKDWMFSVVFDYGDINKKHPQPHSENPWLCRKDPFSSYRSGFEIRTYRLCRRIIMFHHFPAELGVDHYPVGSWSFKYEEHPSLTYLKSVDHKGYIIDENGCLSSKCLPPMTFEYSKFPTDKALDELRIQDIDPASLVNMSGGVDGSLFQWLDLDGEGIPGVLVARDDGWFYKRNLSAYPHVVEDKTIRVSPSFGPMEKVCSIPSISPGNTNAFFTDVQGDGIADLVWMARPTWGFFSRNLNSTIEWDSFRNFESIPNILGETAFKFIDLTGDGLPDILMSDDSAFVWYPSLGEIGYGEWSRTTVSLDNENLPALLWRDPEQFVHLADMSGDGLTDLVRIRNGEVCYWPNLGYGQFGPKILMDNCPWFDIRDEFNQQSILITDIDGSGTNDLVYVGVHGIDVYLNESGNGFSQQKRLSVLPPVDRLSMINAIDLFGNGTSCLVWSSRLPEQSQTSMKYIDFTGGCKPHLLVSQSNNCGAETRIHYAPSTKFYLQDKADGRDWITRLPFPVQVVEKVEVHDQISHTRSVSRYAYHHGYYDGYEREFRGFAMVDQWDTEDFDIMSKTPATNIDASWHLPPTHSKSWFHTGAFLSKGESSLASEFFDIHGDYKTGRSHSERLLMESAMPQGLDYCMTRESYRALKGSPIRSELYAEDSTDKAHIPYTISESNYTVRMLQPQDSHAHSVFTVFGRESVQFSLERDPSDPRVTHGMTLEVDRYGNVLKHLDIAYGRRSSPLTGEEALVQQRSLMTYYENDYTNKIDGLDDYRLPSSCEARPYEISGFHFDGFDRFRMTEFENGVIERLGEIPYESTDCKEKKRRLLGKSRVRFRSNDLARLLPLEEIESMTVARQTFNLAMTPGMLEVFRRDTPAGSTENLIPDPAEILGEMGKYVDLDADGCWWIQSPRDYFHPQAVTPELELTEARKGFFTVRREVDQFGNAHHVDCDRHYLFAIRTVDALGNTSRCHYDYRLLQPKLVYDANGNRSAYAYDELGTVVASAVMGKEDETLGDSLDGFKLATPEQVREFLLNPKGPVAKELLGNATTRTVYDYNRFWLESDVTKKRPTFVATITRETHVSQATNGKLKIQIHFSYIDGFSRNIQNKFQSDPMDEMRDVWITSGWTVFNNKDGPVRQYEPFYDDTHEFVPYNKVGVSSTIIYDPLGRVVATMAPDHSWQKGVITPWQSRQYDCNDTVLWNPKTDIDIGPFVHLLPDEACLPTWFEERDSGALGPAEQAAARKAALHADTPQLTHFDPLGREFLSVQNNGDHGLYKTRVVYDIQGHQRNVVDAKGRVVTHYDYDMAGNTLHEKSMESAERWFLTDVGGGTLYTWDSRMNRLHKVYDQLRHPVTTILQTESGDELAVEKAVYGESLPSPEARNARQRLVMVCDQAGTVTQDMYDFKGNLLCATRRVARIYKTTLDWNGEVALEEPAFTTQGTFDALNRQVETIRPDNSVVRSHYNEAGVLRTMTARVRGAEEWTTFIRNIEYNAKEQWTRVEHGNGTVTAYTYDPLTFALTDLITRRPSKLFPEDCPDPPQSAWPGCYLQNLHYTHDAVGNITSIRDNAQQTIFYQNKRVDPTTEYTYDPLYRLIEVSGREHAGSSPKPHLIGKIFKSVEHPHDGRAISRYRQRYAYDEVGNILTMRHESSSDHQSWTRHYGYEEPSLLEAEKRSNRLSRTAVGSVTEEYGYDDDAGRHGCITSMPGVPVMRWDYKDQLQATARQAIVNGNGVPETTYYVYDSAGQRVRKVTERHAADGQEPVRLKERLYVGIEVFRRFDGMGQTTLERETLEIKDGDNLVALVETRTKGHETLVPRQLVRYQFSNHLQSISLELDDRGRVLTYEEYTPYGSTSYKAVRSGVEVPKRYAYTAKERDEESGMYYYGARYYAAAVARWISCDPSGLVDGTDVYVYVRCNPVCLNDPDGRNGRRHSAPAAPAAPVVPLGRFPTIAEDQRNKYMGEGRIKTVYIEDEPTLDTRQKIFVGHFHRRVVIAQGNQEGDRPTGRMFFVHTWQRRRETQVTPQIVKLSEEVTRGSKFTRIGTTKVGIERIEEICECFLYMSYLQPYMSRHVFLILLLIPLCLVVHYSKRRLRRPPCI